MTDIWGVLCAGGCGAHVLVEADALLVRDASTIFCVECYEAGVYGETLVTSRENAITFRVGFAWFVGWWITTGALYVIFGRCLAAKITCGLALVPFGVGFLAYWLLLICEFLWSTAADFAAWFMEPWRGSRSWETTPEQDHETQETL